ncbi:uncharacterized protein LOC124369634 [Homalodisca vitripennis]|nr:uncharacterized protein LOC124369634 [Homalodisca vitripennis]
MMVDLDSARKNSKWVCPNDRGLALLAKVGAGWSVKTQHNQTYKQQPEALDEAEKQIILEVIQRADALDSLEQERVGRLVDRLDNMKRNAIGSGTNQCILCGAQCVLFGVLSTNSILCHDCRKTVCQKCGVETCSGSRKEVIWRCKICAETREMWKKTGAWFFKAIPKHVLPVKKTTYGEQPTTGASRVKSSELEEESSSDDDRASRLLASRSKKIEEPVNHSQPRFSLLNIRIKLEVISENVRQSILRRNRLNMNLRQDRVSCKKVELLMSAYHLLCDAMQQANDFYCDLLLASIFFTFISITESLYFLFRIIAEEDTKSMWSIAAYVFSNASFLMLITLSGSRVSEAAGETASLTRKLINQDLSSELREELKSFLLQLWNQNVEFSAGGFFQINKETLTSMVATVTTFLTDETTDDRSALLFCLGPPKLNLERIFATIEALALACSTGYLKLSRELIVIPKSLINVGFRTRRGVLHPYKRETSESSESGGSSTATANHCPTWTCDSTISRTRSTNPDTDPDDPSSYFTYSRQNSQLSLLTNRDWYSDCDRFSLSSSSVNGHRAALSHAEDTSEEFSEPLPDGKYLFFFTTLTFRWFTKYKVIDWLVNLGILELTLVYDSETSSIHVSLHRAKNLKPMDINGLADPFCKLNLLPAGTKSHRLRTRTVHKTRNPEFNETLTFYGITENDLAVRALHVLVLGKYSTICIFIGLIKVPNTFVDDDKYGHDFMGEAKYPLDRLRPDVARQLNLFLEKHYPVENEEEVWGEEGWTHGQILITLCYSTRRKALIVGIVRCNNLLPMDSNGFSDPFVKLYLRPDHYHRKYKTCVKWKNLNPIFNEEFVFETKMTDLPQQTLVLTVWDKDYGKSNDYLGCLELGWKSKGERLRQWVDMIKFPDHKHEGLHNLCEEPPPN